MVPCFRNILRQGQYNIDCKLDVLFMDNLTLQYNVTERLSYMICITVIYFKVFCCMICTHKGLLVTSSGNKAYHSSYSVREASLGLEI